MKKSRINADPITGEPGAHPVGTGVEAAVELLLVPLSALRSVDR